MIIIKYSLLNLKVMTKEKNIQKSSAKKEAAKTPKEKKADKRLAKTQKKYD